MEVTTCRICARMCLIKMLDLGRQPLANSLLTTQEEPFTTHPLVLMYCPMCKFGQLSLEVDPATLFSGNYPFLAGQSVTWRKHCADLAQGFALRGGLVIDIGANDGTLLSAFAEYAMRGVGIEPSSVRGKYRKVHAFWSKEIAEQVREEHGLADLVTATNVLAHVPDVHTFIDAVAIALKPGGLFIFEVPDLASLVKYCQYDTIYHEHLSYFSAFSIQQLFTYHSSFSLERIIPVSIHSGSVRVVARKWAQAGKGKFDVEFTEPIYRLSSEVQEWNGQIERIVLDKASKGAIFGYGASAKATVRLNYGREWARCIGGVFDDAPTKIGKWIPGVRIPIVSPEQISQLDPDYILALSRNIEEELWERAMEFGFKGEFIPLGKEEK